MNIRFCAIHGAAWIAMTAGCTSDPGRLQAPKAVFDLELAPYATMEECVELDLGERINYRFEARQPVAFNIHFHESNAVILPLTRDNTTSESGDFTADRPQIYCLAWEAGPEGSILDYRISPWTRPK